MGGQAPDGSIHVSVDQDVARCILLAYFDDLCVSGSHEDFTLTQVQVNIHESPSVLTFSVEGRAICFLPFLCTQIAHSQLSVQFLI